MATARWIVGLVLVTMMGGAWTAPLAAAVKGAALSADRQKLLRTAAAKARPTPAQVAEAEARLAKLDPRVQDLVLRVLEPVRGGAVVHIPRRPSGPPSIIRISPAEGSPGGVLVIQGGNLTDDCLVCIQKAKLPATRIFNHLVVTVPAATPLGSTPLKLWDAGRNLAGPEVMLPVAAERGFRGVHGFNFHDPSVPTLPWTVFRDHFGPAEVEYPNGVRRPGARAWYDAVYQRAGADGTCLGMAMRAIRARRRDWRGTQSAWWVANEKPRVWDYPKAPQVLESIMWDQGGQFSTESLVLVNHRYNHQSAVQAFDFVKAAVGSGVVGRQPILGMWSATSGHAVVAHDTTQAWSKRTIRVWDGSTPYRPVETGDDGSEALLGGSGDFRYGPYTKAIAVSFDELNHPDPTLPVTPVGAVPAGAANLGLLVVDEPTALVSLADASGRWLWKDGSENGNAMTRIPEAMPFVPFAASGGGGAGPVVFVFGAARGATYELTMAPGKAATIRAFSRGLVTELLSVRGRVRLANMLEPGQAVEFPDLSASRPGGLRFVAVEADGSERVVDVKPTGLLPDGPVTVALDAGRKGVLVRNGGRGALDLTLGFAGHSPAGAVSTKVLPPSRVPGGRVGVLAAPDFGKLETLTPSAFKVLQGR